MHKRVAGSGAGGTDQRHVAQKSNRGCHCKVNRTEEQRNLFSMGWQPTLPTLRPPLPPLSLSSLSSLKSCMSARMHASPNRTHQTKTTLALVDTNLRPRGSISTMFCIQGPILQRAIGARTATALTKRRQGERSVSYHWSSCRMGKRTSPARSQCSIPRSSYEGEKKKRLSTLTVPRGGGVGATGVRENIFPPFN